MAKAGGRTNGAKRSISEAQAQWNEMGTTGVRNAKRVSGPTPNPTGSYSGNDIPRDLRTIETTSPPSFPAVRSSLSLNTPNFELVSGDVAWVKQIEARGVAKTGGPRIRGTINGTLFRDAPPVNGYNIACINKEALKFQLAECANHKTPIVDGVMPRELLNWDFMEQLFAKFNCIGTIATESGRGGGDSHSSSFTGKNKSPFGILHFDRTKLCGMNLKGWGRIRNCWSRWIVEGTDLWFRWQPITIASNVNYVTGYVPSGRSMSENPSERVPVGTTEGAEGTFWQLVPYILSGSKHPKCRDSTFRVKTNFTRRDTATGAAIGTDVIEITVKSHALQHVGITRVSLVEQMSQVSPARVATNYQYLRSVDQNDIGAVQMVGAQDKLLFVK
jgi:hypothetical protein